MTHPAEAPDRVLKIDASGRLTDVTDLAGRLFQALEEQTDALMRPEMWVDKEAETVYCCAWWHKHEVVPPGAWSQFRLQLGADAAPSTVEVATMTQSKWEELDWDKLKYFPVPGSST